MFGLDHLFIRNQMRLILENNIKCNLLNIIEIITNYK